MATATFAFDEARHLYLEDGLPLPSVTQVLKAEGLISFEGIPFHVLERKRQLGSLVHKITELYDNGELLDDYEIPDECWPYVDGWINFCNDSGFVPELVEHQQIGDVHGMRYGMRLDCLGPINGEPNIVEKKCGASEHPAWGVQMGGYALGIQRPHIARTAVQLGPKFPRKYKTFRYEEPTDLVIFSNCLANAVWKQNKGLFVFENIPERVAA